VERACTIGSGLSPGKRRAPRQRSNNKAESVMIELLSTNDPVKLNFVQTVLRDAGIHTVTLDEGTSAIFAGALPWIKRRILVHEDDLEQARRLLKDALPKDEGG